MAAHILIDGQGLLADFVYDQLSGNYLVKRQSILEEVPEETELALVLHDAWHPSVHQKAEERFRATGIPWLRGFVSFGEGIIGPLVHPDTPGCSRCADIRRIDSWIRSPRNVGVSDENGSRRRCTARCMGITNGTIANGNFDM